VGLSSRSGIIPLSYDGKGGIGKETEASVRLNLFTKQ